ncbi:hypothetical protein FRC03_004435 [Tulasnella sp. 419]|nr:hypothetical protein FRC03_004435 [Tulasnella sp. 419]
MANYPLTFSNKDNEVLTTLSKSKSNIWVLELQGAKDSRLTGEMCQKGILPALDIVEKEWRNQWREASVSNEKKKGAGSGALVITGRLSQNKFFSNGFDYPEVIGTPGWGFIVNNFNPILARLMSFPIPIVAALNGHTYAAGFMLALACDYRVMTSGRAWACMNEVHFGAPLPHSFSAILQEKARNPQLLRAIALEGKQFTPQELVAHGVVDKLADGGYQDVLQTAVDLAETVSVNASNGVWGLIKKGIYGETLHAISQDIRQIMPVEEDAAMRAKL